MNCNQCHMSPCGCSQSTIHAFQNLQAALQAARKSAVQVLNEEEDPTPPMTWETIMETAWDILWRTPWDPEDPATVASLVQSHVWMAEEIRKSQESVPEKIKNLLDAYASNDPDQL